MEHILREKIKFRFVLIQHTPRDLIEPIRNCQKGEQWGGGGVQYCAEYIFSGRLLGLIVDVSVGHDVVLSSVCRVLSS